jgi:hypothetical protein
MKFIFALIFIFIFGHCYLKTVEFSSKTVSKTVSSSNQFENPSVDSMAEITGDLNDEFGSDFIEIESPVEKNENEKYIEWSVKDVEKEDVSIKIVDGIMKILVKNNRDGSISEYTTTEEILANYNLDTISAKYDPQTRKVNLIIEKIKQSIKIEIK